MAQAPKTALPKYNARRGLWVGGDSRTLYTFTDPATGRHRTTHGTRMSDGTHFKHYRIDAGPNADVRVATRAEADAAGYTQGGGGWTTLGRLRAPGEEVIAFETDQYWVKRVPKGFEVYKTGLTHSTRVAIIGYTGAVGLRRAKQEIERRQGAPLGRLGPSGSYAGKTNFQWLQRDVATALRRRDCGSARTMVAKAVLAARSPKERGAVVTMQQKVLRCDLALTGTGRARRRRAR